MICSAQTCLSGEVAVPIHLCILSSASAPFSNRMGRSSTVRAAIMLPTLPPPLPPSPLHRWILHQALGGITWVQGLGLTSAAMVTTSGRHSIMLVSSPRAGSSMLSVPGYTDMMPRICRGGQGEHYE